MNFFTNFLFIVTMVAMIQKNPLEYIAIKFDTYM
jgi:hypothetical protein